MGPQETIASTIARKAHEGQIDKAGVDRLLHRLLVGLARTCAQPASTTM